MSLRTGRRPVLAALIVAAMLASGMLGLYLATAAVESVPQATVASVNDWSANLALTGSIDEGGNLTGTPSLRFGVHPSCTDGFDMALIGTCDVAGSLIPSPDELQAYWVYPGNTASDFFETQKLPTSRIASGDPMTWPMQIKVAKLGATAITITINASEIADIPGANDPLPLQVLLLDKDGAQIADLRAQSTVTLNRTLVSGALTENFTVKVFTQPPAPPATAVIASPAASPAQNEGAVVTFSSAGSAPGSGATNIATYAWDFGDSTGTSDEANPKYIYTDDSGAGTFTVTLNVTDTNGGKGTASVAIKVNNVAPTIAPGGITATPDPVNEGSSTSIGVNATDPGGANDPLSFSFDCNGDGDFTDAGDVANQSTNTHTCTFADDSLHAVNVSVADGDGGVTPGIINVTVNNVAPSGNVSASPTTVNEGGSVSIIASFTDPGGANDPLTYSFDCNDDNTFETVQSGSSTTCTFLDNSVHKVNVSVADDDGGVSLPRFVNVNVNNVAPVVASVTATPDVHPVSGDSTITVSATDVTADLPLTYFFSCDGDDVYEIGPQKGGNTAVCSFSATPTGPNTVKVKVQDKDGGEGFSSTIVSVGAPVTPSLVSPLNDTTPVLTNFKWVGDALSDTYTLEISLGTGNFNPPLRTIPVTHQGAANAEQSHKLATGLDAGTSFKWRIKATSTATTLSSEFSQPASFVTPDAQTTLVLQVTLQGTGTPSVAPKFGVKLFKSGAFRDPSEPRWAILGKTPSDVFPDLTGTATGRTYTLSIPNVTTGFYDITIESDHTLVNLKNDAQVHLAAGAIGMGTLKEGNAVNDVRIIPVELSTIINALDASALATSLNRDSDAVLGEPTYDARLDFNRDGKVNAADLVLLRQNYLEFSPVLVLP